MATDLNAVITTCAVDQELIVDIDGDMVNVHPSAAFPRTASSGITAILSTSAWIEARKENQVSRL